MQEKIKIQMLSFIDGYNVATNRSYLKAHVIDMAFKHYEAYYVGNENALYHLRRVATDML